MGIDCASERQRITINANPGDKINIIGVVLDGTALTNTTGIQFNSGGSLTVRDSVIRNFTTHGILFQTISSTQNQLFLSNTLVSDNGVNGVFINTAGSGTTKGVLNHVEMQNNGNDGLHVTSSQTINITVTDVVSANNQASGIVAISSGGTVLVMVQNSTIANNGTNGLEAIGGAGVLVSRSTITGNNVGWTDVSFGEVLSYVDNNIDLNNSVNSTPPVPFTYH